MTRAGQPIGTRDRCPRRCVTAAHAHLLVAYRERQAGQPVYPSLSEYPTRLLQQFAILQSEDGGDG